MHLASVGSHVRLARYEAEAPYPRNACGGSYATTLEESCSRPKGLAFFREGRAFFEGSVRLGRGESTKGSSFSQDCGEGSDFGVWNEDYRGCRASCNGNVEWDKRRKKAISFSKSAVPKFGYTPYAGPSRMSAKVVCSASTSSGSGGSTASSSSNTSEYTGVTVPSLRRPSIYRPFQLQASGHDLMVISSLDGPSSVPNDDTMPAYVKTEPSNRHTVTIFYATGWSRPVLHYTTNLDYGRWRQAPFHDADAHSKRWKVITIPVAHPPTRTHAIEFVITDGSGQWDHPFGRQDGNYTIEDPGIYVLQKGLVETVPRLDPFLVVGDLEGTLVGNHESMLAFKSYWDIMARSQGAKLVYCSGRSLSQYEDVRRLSGGHLARPDGYISGLGTKVYFWHNEQHEWVEDINWSKRLDFGWDLQQVRESAYRALAAVGRDSVMFRPPEEQNEHKITLGVREDVLEEVLEVIKESLLNAGVEAKIISSGAGSWKFVDIIALRAGKAEATDYVRHCLGFCKQRTLTCGYSESDISLLVEGTRVVIVGNAQQPLIKWAQEKKQLGLIPEDTIFAEQVVAFGIMEGIRDLGLDPSLGSFPGAVYLLKQPIDTDSREIGDERDRRAAQ